MALTLASADLYFQSGSSDKEYHTQLVKHSSGTYSVHFQYGRRGSALNAGEKIQTPEEAKARKVYDRLVAEKTGKGYELRTGMITQTGVVGIPALPIESQDPTGMLPGTLETVTTPFQTATAPLFVPNLLMPIDEDEVNTYLNDSGYVAQEKMDGVHKTIENKNGRVIVRNKLGKPVAATELKLPDGLHIDCEQIGDTFYIFDVMKKGGRDYTGRCYTERMEEIDHLVELLNNFNEGSGVTFRGVPFFQNTKNKKDFYDQLKRGGKEGIVFKRIDTHYQSGSRNSDMIKFKFWHELSARVTAGREGKRSIGLELMNEHGTWVFMGNCTIGGKKPIPLIESLVEIKYLYANRGGHLYQPSFKKLRDDVTIYDCSMSQVKYKDEPAPDYIPDVPNQTAGHIVDGGDRQLDM